MLQLGFVVPPGTHAHTHTQTTLSDLSDELLVDFEPSITANIFSTPPLRPCTSLVRCVYVFQQPFSRPPVVN